MRYLNPTKAPRLFRAIASIGAQPPAASRVDQLEASGYPFIASSGLMDEQFICNDPHHAGCPAGPQPPI
jgi:hypothetical protein